MTGRASPSRFISVTAKRLGEKGTVRELFNDSPPLSYIAGRLGVRVHLDTECRLPIGAGFGLSAAALMASAAAINTLFGLGLTKQACAELAHEAEIVHRTGLGDAAACQDGGRDFRLGPGIGAEIRRFYDLEESLYAVNFGPLHSPLILGSSEALHRIIAAYPEEYPGSSREFFRLSLSLIRSSTSAAAKVDRSLYCLVVFMDWCCWVLAFLVTGERPEGPDHDLMLTRSMLKVEWCILFLGKLDCFEQYN